MIQLVFQKLSKVRWQVQDHELCALLLYLITVQRVMTHQHTQTIA